MNVICGEYLHFKGKPYIVYGTAVDESGEKYVLYQHDYGTKEFWIRPVAMFYEIIERDGMTMPRFKLVNEFPAEESFDKLMGIIVNESLKINHSETLEVYDITKADKEHLKIYIEKSTAQ